MILIVCVCEYEDSKRIDFSNIQSTWKPIYLSILCGLMIMFKHLKIVFWVFLSKHPQKVFKQFSTKVYQMPQKKEG